MTAAAQVGSALWREPRWRAAALAWADGELERLGRRRAGSPEQPHVRPWSTVLRLPLADGDWLWLKGTGPGSGHEPALTAALHRRAPGRVVEPVALDPAQGLLLLRDGGVTLRSTGRTVEARAWEPVLAEYGQLQREVEGDVALLLAAGVPDLRPHRLPALVAALVGDDEAMLAGRSGGPPPDRLARLRAGLPAYAAACERLAAFGVPASAQHDDLHDANVFVDGERYRYFDWGDACVGHPFTSLLVAMRSAGARTGLAPDDPALDRLRDAYLEPWTAEHGRPALREALALAEQVGTCARALAWQRVLAGVTPEERSEHADAVPGWAGEWLADP